MRRFLRCRAKQTHSGENLTSAIAFSVGKKSNDVSNKSKESSTSLSAACSNRTGSSCQLATKFSFRRSMRSQCCQGNAVDVSFGIVTVPVQRS